MIKHIAGSSPTRSRATVHDGLVYTVAVSPEKHATMYEQARDALAQLDRNLADAGTDKSMILRATVYITNMADKAEMNRAWDEWVEMTAPPQRACTGVTLEGRDLIEIVVTAALP